MAHRQRLRLTLRKRSNGYEWRPIEVTEDPDDHDAMLEHLDAMARDLDGRTGNPWWRDQYEVRVQGLEQEWRDFRVAGRSER